MRLALLICTLFTVGGVHADAAPLPDFGKVIDTDWVEQATLKYGMLGSLCATQALTGMTEGYSFGGDGRLVSSGNYHAVETARRVGWISVGWLAYANVRDADLTWWGKTRRLVGSALIARNFFEWSYKFQRYGDPFDYSEAHNQHSLVYFKISRHGIIDAYIGTGPVSGPIVDALFMIGGALLYK